MIPIFDIDKLKLSKSLEQRRVYTVWVGGTEVNDHLLSLSDAQDLASEYQQDGYDDVVIEAVVETDDPVYTVWVGGAEVNDYLLSLSDAQDLAFEYQQDGYDDVYIVNTVTNEVKNHCFPVTIRESMS